MALNLNRQQVEAAAAIHGVGSLRENVAEGEFSEEDARAILSAKGFDLSFINEQYPDDEGFGIIDPVLEAAELALGTVTSAITTPLDNVIIGAADIAALIEGTVADVIDENLGTVQAGIDELESFFMEQIDEQTDNLADRVAGYEAIVTGRLDEALAAGEDVERSITATIWDAIEDAISTGQRGEQQVISDINAFTDVALDEAEALLENIEEDTKGFATALREQLPQLGDQFKEGITGLGDVLPEALLTGLSGALNAIGLDKLVDMFSLLNRASGMMETILPGDEPLVIKEGSWDLRYSSADEWNLALASMPLVGGYTQLTQPAEIERIRQDNFNYVRPTQLDTGSVLEHLRRFPAQFADVIPNLQRAGLSEQKINQLVEIMHQPLPLIELIEAWRRELITTMQFDQALRENSLAPESIELVKELAYRLPPVQDLITMSVREVFSPEIAEEFGQFDDIPPAYLKWAKQAGLSEEWATNYWAAHWTLPSIQMGFEMLHRGVIDEDQLDKLMIALDIMPGWRDDLKAISYSPFTRVDIRRMYALGVLDREQVYNAYKDIGYNFEKAAQLTEFTIRYTEAQTKTVKTRERDLSKSDVIGLFNDGVIDKTTTINYLVELGYSQDEAFVLVTREEIQDERRERKEEINLIIDQAKIKVLSYEQAQDRLAALDLSPTESKKATNALVRATEARTRTPSKADLDNWLSLGLLSRNDYEEEMRALGYPDKYIDLYMEAMTAEADEDILAPESREAGRREPRRVTKGQLDSLYTAQIILEDEYVAGLRTLGFRDADIANFLVQINLKLDEIVADEQARRERGEAAPPRERLPNRTLLGKMYLKGLISIDAYSQGLARLGFSPENIELLARLISDKQAEELAEE